MDRRFLGLIVVLVVLTFLVVGCGGAASEEPAFPDIPFTPPAGATVIIVNPGSQGTPGPTPGITPEGFGTPPSPVPTLAEGDTGTSVSPCKDEPYNDYCYVKSECSGERHLVYDYDKSGTLFYHYSRKQCYDTYLGFCGMCLDPIIEYTGQSDFDDFCPRDFPNGFVNSDPYGRQVAVKKYMISNSDLTKDFGVQLEKLCRSYAAENHVEFKPGLIYSEVEGTICGTCIFVENCGSGFECKKPDSDCTEYGLTTKVYQEFGEEGSEEKMPCYLEEAPDHLGLCSKCFDDGCSRNRDKDYTCKPIEFRCEEENTELLHEIERSENPWRLYVHECKYSVEGVIMDGYCSWCTDTKPLLRIIGYDDLYKGENPDEGDYNFNCNWYVPLNDQIRSNPDRKDECLLSQDTEANPACANSDKVKVYYYCNKHSTDYPYTPLQDKCRNDILNNNIFYTFPIDIDSSYATEDAETYRNNPENPYIGCFVDNIPKYKADGTPDPDGACARCYVVEHPEEQASNTILPA
ncbi:MAG: hypothetical protein KKF44_10360 [Nanoarchaeota archaeon]|nr:hypothetical protein [Nanoarchaeota archaeon]